MLPVWALKALPYLGAVVLVGGAVAYIDHRGYQRAEHENELAQARAEKERLIFAMMLTKKTREFEGAMQQTVLMWDQRLQTRLSNLDTAERTIIQPTLVKEIASAPHLSDPRYGITDGMLRAINQSRSYSWPGGACATTADGTTTCSLPAARPVEGQDNGNPSQ